jgi:chromosome segregation ATPase
MMRSREQLEEALKGIDANITALNEQRNEIDEQIKALLRDRGTIQKRLRTGNSPSITTPSTPSHILDKRRRLLAEWLYFTTQDLAKRHQHKPLMKHIRRIRGKVGELDRPDGWDEMDKLLDLLLDALPQLREKTDLEFTRLQKIIFSE